MHKTFSNDGCPCLLLSGPSSETTNTRALLQLRVPILNGGGAKASVSQAKHLLKEQIKMQDKIKKLVLLESSKILATLSILQENVSAFKSAITAQELALSVEARMYSEGLIENSKVLDSQKDLSESKRRYLSAKRKLTLMYKQFLINIGL